MNPLKISDGFPLLRVPLKHDCKEAAEFYRKRWKPTCQFTWTVIQLMLAGF